MSVFGFSHIVTEVKNLERTLAFYEDLGYISTYTIDQKVPGPKRGILVGSPTEVTVLYLKHRDEPRIGIELIRHDDHKDNETGGLIAYGWGGDPADGFRIDTDPDGNSIVICDTGGPDSCQHIFVPTNELEKSAGFYKEVFCLAEKEIGLRFQNVYNKLFGKTGKSIILELSGCLYPGWNACLHLVKTGNASCARYLNSYGFSCFCLLVNDEELRRYYANKIDVIGPFKGIKDAKGGTTEFEIGFIRDPSGFPIEFYISGAPLGRTKCKTVLSYTKSDRGSE